MAFNESYKKPIVLCVHLVIIKHIEIIIIYHDKV